MKKKIARKKTAIIPLALLAAICAVTAPAHGSISFTTVAGNDGDGNLAATLTFTAVNGGLDISVANTLSGSDASAFGKGQAISAFSFTLDNGLTATAFTELTGVSYAPSPGSAWTTASGTSFSDTSSSPPINSIDHWGFNISGGSTNAILATAGSPVPGSGNPQFMILPSSGTAGPGSSLANSNFYPFVIGPAEFFISVPGLSSTSDLTNKSSSSALWDITSVDVSFGTGPDKTLGTTNGPTPPPPPAVPEPTSLAVWGIVSAATAGAAVMRKQKRGRSKGRWSEANRSAILQAVGCKTRI